ncbi:MAG: ATP-dependent DNA helicase RecG, partial [Oxalobacteraceae bacterium]
MPIPKQNPEIATAAANSATAPAAAPVAAPAAEKKAAPAQKKPGKLSARFAKFGLRTGMDFVLHLPARYEDETEIVPIIEAAARFGQPSQVEGIVTGCDVQCKPRKQLIVTIADDSGHQLVMRFINFYGSQQKQMAVGRRIRARGEVRHGFFGPEMVHPSFKIVTAGAPLAQALTPVYPAGVGLSQAILRKAINEALNRVQWRDTLSPLWRQRLELMEFEPAIRLLHNPPQNIDQYTLTERTHPAWERMKFDELLAQQLSMKRAQAARRSVGAPKLDTVGQLSNAFLMTLPFALTGAQQKVLAEIRSDLRAEFPMQRLLQGDVGSGKTVVAALAAAQAIDSGFQAALMAPTEILAEQHFRKLAGWMEPLGITVAWLTGSLKKKEKAEAKALIESGAAQLVVGTHALLQHTVQFANLGLVIVDEQHRFGVGQRLTLRNKGTAKGTIASSDLPDGASPALPHQLMMSATPIPRTLAMTYYADLEVSVIDELPPGRTPIVTRAIDQNRRDEVI